MVVVGATAGAAGFAVPWIVEVLDAVEVVDEIDVVVEVVSRREGFVAKGTSRAGVDATEVASTESSKQRPYARTTSRDLAMRLRGHLRTDCRSARSGTGPGSGVASPIGIAGRPSAMS